MASKAILLLLYMYLFIHSDSRCEKARFFLSAIWYQRLYSYFDTCIFSVKGCTLSRFCTQLTQQVQTGRKQISFSQAILISHYSTQVYRKCSSSIQIWIAFLAYRQLCCSYPLSLFGIVNKWLDVIQINSQLNFDLRQVVSIGSGTP